MLSRSQQTKHGWPAAFLQNIHVTNKQHTNTAAQCAQIMFLAKSSRWSHAHGKQNSRRRWTSFKNVLQDLDAQANEHFLQGVRGYLLICGHLCCMQRSWQPRKTIHHRIKVRIMEPTEESFTEPWDLGPGNTFQKRKVSSPAASSRNSHHQHFMT